MTVWTPVSLHEANAWLESRDLGRAVAITPVHEGVEDSVFRLDMADDAPLCLRLFERTEPEGPLSLATELAACGLLTCPPLVDRQERLAMPLKNKPAALFPWIEGSWEPDPSLEQIAQIGTFLGHIAKEGSTRCASWRRQNPRDWAWFENTAASLLEVLPQEQGRDLAQEMQVHRLFWHDELAADLPKGPVHADLFRNNVMFKPDKTLGAVIDWGFCASGEALLYDLAIVINDWCLIEGGYTLDEAKLEALLQAREEILPLQDEEKEALPMALRLAALRFYLSRLYDYHLPRDPNGKTLDTAHFGKVLAARQKLQENPSVSQSSSARANVAAIGSAATGSMV